MAFSFGPGNQALNGGGSAGPSIESGPDLEDITTEALGFLSLSGESKVQLLPTPWPSEDLPPPTASLMSVASRQGLLAAAGPDAVIVATTESVRKAFESNAEGHIKPFQPQLTLPMQMRISQIAFSADEAYLILSAQNGGGLAVYDVKAVLANSTQSAFEMSTNGEGLRALTPNPTPEKAELFAVVTDGGNLMMANLKEKAFVPGPNGQILKDGVSCISWSTKGKQLVAGLANGTVCQMTPEGAVKGEIPRPPNVGDGNYVSSITWLKNHVFLLVHTPVNYDTSMAPQSIFHVVTRNLAGTSFSFSKIPDPAGPFGLNRSPPHHFILRLRAFPPNLEDLLIVASTASTDIGLLSESKAPLTRDKPADKITGIFTMTEMADDSRRAQLPSTSDLGDTSPIGLALDLSSKEKIFKPAPFLEVDESPGPLPALMVLNNEGVLASWWVVYSESIREGISYPGLVALEGSQSSGQTAPQLGPQAQAPTSAFGVSSTPAFSAPAFGGPSTISSPFGSSASASGAPGTGIFGSTGGLGKSPSPWSTPSANTTSSAAAFGSSSFGSGPSSTGLVLGGSTFPTSKPAFGSSGLPGSRQSPWASASTTAPTAAFGQESRPASVFGSTTSNTTTLSSGFASFAGKGGFSSAAPSTGGSIFGSKPATSLFSSASGGSEMETSTSFGSFASKTDEAPANPFGGEKFVLGSTFTASNTEKDELELATVEKGSLFDGNFSNALAETEQSSPVQTTVSKDADMDASEDTTKLQENTADSTTPGPTSTPAISGAHFSPTGGSTPKPAPSPPPATSRGLFGAPSSIPTNGGFFGSVGSLTHKPSPFGGLSSGKAAGSGATPNPFQVAGPSGSITNGLSDTFTPPQPTKTAAASQTPPSPKIKEESDSGFSFVGSDVPDAPLPPDPTSKTIYAPGDTSVSSSNETDAPFPPDFISKPTPKPTQPEIPPPPAEKSISSIPSELVPSSEVPEGPEEEEGDDSDFLTEDDGDGESENATEGTNVEDVTKEINTRSQTATPGFTPQSSFGGVSNQNNGNTLFAQIQNPNPATSRPRSLFGEVGGLSVPKLPPPPKMPNSPRSPSPVRSAIPGRMMARPENSRSVSAPQVASNLLGPQRMAKKSVVPSQSTFDASVQQHKADEQRRIDNRTRKEAEETQPLVDDEDELMQRTLAEEVKGTTTLDEFVAISNYVTSTVDTIPAQVETIYRDINSMIDTLGLNSRSLNAFIKGHTEQYKEEDRTREDLENENDWCLDEIPRLSHLIEKELTGELYDGRVQDVASKLETCTDLLKDLVRLRAKNEDIKKIYYSHTHPEHLAVTRAQPLSAEQAAQQNDLRRDFTKFQSLLSEAEKGLTLLRANLASQASSNRKANQSSGPTVEAVLRTITKMTSMAEKRSGDIDVLEGQMRRLNFSPAPDASRYGREGSPFGTPQNNRVSLRNPGASAAGRSFFTPDSVKNTPRGFRSSLMSSTNSPPRKKLSGYTNDEKGQLRVKLARKKEVTDRLRAALKKAGTSIRTMDDE